MPIISSSYKPPFIFRNGFVSTVYSGLARKIHDVNQERERMTLSDGDFLDLDWSFSKEKTNKLIIVLHGLEGNAQRAYMLGAAKIFNQNYFDAVCVNFRSCSGEQNLKYRSYHSGVTEDLEDVINHIISTKHYSEIYINGFSLGGNVALKYVGEGRIIPNQIKSVVAVSVPIFLYGSMLELHKFKNIPYHDRFKRHLKNKLKQKQKQFPDLVSDSDINKIKTLKDFDDAYTSKAHGFKDALDYYAKSSSLQFLNDISIPTLLINAENDSFLSLDCYPIEEAKANSNLYLEMPKYGGHVGFYDKNNVYYNEKRALEFLIEKD
ncbi:MAG: alpha/beta fold hydrolase [Flavobacteriaceae bacterium]|nr:alpha/beta fold hydrolase [Flavobacteriaceae bacterium]